MRAVARAVQSQWIDVVSGELEELGRECARVLVLLRRLAKARAARRDTSDVLGELTAIILHLHVHTQGLDALIEKLEERGSPPIARVSRSHGASRR